MDKVTKTHFMLFFKKCDKINYMYLLLASLNKMTVRDNLNKVDEIINFKIVYTKTNNVINNKYFFLKIYSLKTTKVHERKLIIHKNFLKIYIL